MPLDDLTNETLLKEETELGQAFDNLDKDIEDSKAGLSQIDFNSRITSDERSAMMIIDELRNIGIVPPHWGLTRMAKRLSVSLDGKGRSEKVQIASAVITSKKESGLLGGLFQRRE